MQPYLKYLFLVFLASGCHEKEAPLFSDELMIDILVDVHLAEAALQGLQNMEKDSFTSVYYNQIYQIHEVEEADFKAQMQYMKQHPDYMEKIYEQVLDEMTRREAELKAK